MEVQVLSGVVFSYRVVDRRCVDRFETPFCSNVTYIKLDIQVIDREIGTFRSWVYGAFSSTLFFITEYRSYEGICYTTRSPHAQTKYGFHLGIRYVNIRLYIWLSDGLILRGILNRLRAYCGIETVKVTFIDRRTAICAYFDKMPQLDKSTCIVQIFPVVAFMLLVLSVVWFGGFLYTYIFCNGRMFLYVLNHFAFHKFEINLIIGSLGGVQNSYGRCAMHGAVPLGRRIIKVLF